jgi:exopolysaccharide biosynthesis predicted pyruvyltransferase EpsI
MKHNELMTELYNSLQQLTDKIKHKKVIYIDYPVHHNIGDLLIYLGALRLLKQQGIEIVSRISALNCDKKAIAKIINKYDGKVSIVFHGGGNLGDLYALHQQCRLQVISAFPVTNTVVFPQTVFYQDQKQLDKDAIVFSKHSDITLFVRDEKSLALAQKLCGKAFLCPDTAHRLWEKDRFLGINKTTGEGTLIFRRRDIESEQLNNDAFDWEDIISKGDNRFKQRLRRFITMDKSSLLGGIFAMLWERHCLKLCRRAAEEFNKYESIETDRLHGHILSCLLSHNNIVLDNSYGKNSTYIKQWTEKSPISNVIK